MDTATIINFIDQTIKKTKMNELRWTLVNENSFIKPLPENTATLSSVALCATKPLIQSCSYVANYKTGELMLLAYSSPVSLAISLPPDHCTLSLRMQDRKSKYAVEICNSDVSSEIATQLIRLYNLIDKDSSSVKALINDFLNS